jgi:hypothetical protein
MYDAVYVLAHGLQQVDKSTRLRLVNLSCDGDQAWAFGSSLYNYLNLVSIVCLQKQYSWLPFFSWANIGDCFVLCTVLPLSHHPFIRAFPLRSVSLL